MKSASTCRSRQSTRHRDRGSTLLSGSKNDALLAGGYAARIRNSDNIRSALSASYITGSHNAKIGYEGAYFMEKTTPKVNDPRLTIFMQTPASTCASNNSCGNTSLLFPGGSEQHAVPPAGSDQLHHEYRYGHARRARVVRRAVHPGSVDAQPRHAERGAAVRPRAEPVRRDVRRRRRNEPYVPIQSGGAYDGQRFWCTEPSNGVNYNDITPRWNVAWDVFGNGKTSVKLIWAST